MVAVSGAPSDTPPPTGEEVAREKMAADTLPVDEAITGVPRGGLKEDVLSKNAANAMGDQDAANTAYTYPPGADQPTAENVRRYPQLFDQSVIDTFQIDDTPTDASESTTTEPTADFTAEPATASEVASTPEQQASVTSQGFGPEATTSGS